VGKIPRLPWPNLQPLCGFPRKKVIELSPGTWGNPKMYPGAGSGQAQFFNVIFLTTGNSTEKRNEQNI